MSHPAGGGSPVSLRRAAATVHADPRWWLHCLGYGFAAATGLGLPLAVGFVLESFDNSRKGYPTPLPPWSDPFTRVLSGFFALMIDFSFFILPLLLGGMLAAFASIAIILISGSTTLLGPALSLIALLSGGTVVGFWLGSVAPLARLLFVHDGQIELALSSKPLHMALERRRGPRFLRARLASLGGYLPAVGLAVVTVALARPSFAGQTLAVALGLWLTMAALVYAHLIVVQLYVAAER